MVKLALLDPSLAAAIQERKSAGADDVAELDLVCAAYTLEELLSLQGGVDVIVADSARLGPDPVVALTSIRERLGARTVITVYSFARRDDVERWRQAGSDIVLQRPLTVRGLRMYLLSMLIENHITKPREARPEPGPSAEASPVSAALFSSSDLARLREVNTSIQCECPNHLADLLDRLQSFEAYSKDCENRDDADARMHRTLWFASARARRILEEALVELMKHENIVLPPKSARHVSQAPGLSAPSTKA